MCFTSCRTLIELNRFTLHRLILAAFVCAVKYHEDGHYSNIHYANIGGVDLLELNELEAKFMLYLSYDLTVSRDEYRAVQMRMLATANASLTICFLADWRVKVEARQAEERRLRRERKTGQSQATASRHGAGRRDGMVEDSADSTDVVGTDEAPTRRS